MLVLGDLNAKFHTRLTNRSFLLQGGIGSRRNSCLESTGSQYRGFRADIRRPRGEERASTGKRYGSSDVHQGQAVRSWVNEREYEINESSESINVFDKM